MDKLRYKNPRPKLIGILSTKTLPNSNFGSWKRRRRRAWLVLMIGSPDWWVYFTVINDFIWWSRWQYVSISACRSFQNPWPAFPAFRSITPARLHSSGLGEAALPQSRISCSILLLLLHPRSRPRPRFRILDSWWENEFLPLIAP